MSEDIVKFMLPDGTEVSNDPRFASEREIRAAVVNFEPNTGKVGYSDDELEAASLLGRAMAELQSGQQGVGENAVPADLTRNLTPGLRGDDVQVDFSKPMEREKAREAGLDPTTETVSEDDVADSNEAILQQREARLAEIESTPTPGGNADDQVDEEPDPATSVDDLTVPQLKREAKRAGIDTKGKKVGEVREALKEKLGQLPVSDVENATPEPSNSSE